MRLGRGKTADLRRSKTTGDLFSFARLFALSTEFKHIFRQCSPEGAGRFQNIPGEVKHRLKIVSELAKIMVNPPSMV